MPQTHEDVFLEHYAALKRRAVRLAQGDSARAEDLLHDVFVQFTLARPNLDDIDNTEAYLFATARNLYISQSRLAINNRLNQLSIYEYDSAEIGLRAVFSNSDEIITAQHELRQVCRYACARKESSAVGSILILRFFHGYFPSEIALISKSNRRARQPGRSMWRLNRLKSNCRRRFPEN